MNIERPLIELYRENRMIKPGDTVIQVGCNMLDNNSSFAFSMADIVGPKGCVIIIEPNHEDIAMAEIVARDYDCQVITVNKALWHVPHQKTLLHVGRFTPDSNRFGQLDLIKTTDNFQRTNFDGTPPMEVETDTLDNILQQLGVSNVSHIELTVNGAEWNALLGMENTLKTPGLSLRIATGRNEPCVDGRINGKEDYICITEFLQERDFQTTFKRIQLPDKPELIIFGFLVAVRTPFDKDLNFVRETNWGYSRPVESEETRLKRFHRNQIIYQYRIASETENNQQYQDALKLFDLLLQKESIPDDIMGGIHFHRGRIYYMLKNNERAKECFLKTVALIPDHHGAKMFLDRLAAGLVAEESR